MTNQQKNKSNTKEQCEMWNKVAINYGRFKNTKLFYNDHSYQQLLINETNFMF